MFVRLFLLLRSMQIQSCEVYGLPFVCGCQGAMNRSLEISGHQIGGSESG